MLIDKLWVPEWSSSLPKSSRRVIGLVLAAIDGRPYAKPFVPEVGGYVGHGTPVVGFPIKIEQAFGVIEAEAERAISGALDGFFKFEAQGDFTPPFRFNT